MIRFIFLISISMITSTNAAELFKWETSKLSYKAKLEDKGTPFIFKFTNVSGKDISIKKIKSSCGCMSIKSKFPSTISAGATGAIEAYYDFTGKVGFNRGNIELTVEGKRITLNVEVDIPVPVTVNPRFLIWKKGERNTKEVAIKIHPDWGGKMLSAKSSIDDLKAVMEKTEDGYKVKVTPPSAEKLGKKRTWIMINGEDEKGKHTEHRIYLILN